MKKKNHFLRAVGMLLTAALSTGLLAVPAAAASCSHPVTKTVSERGSCTEPGATVTTCMVCGEELSRTYDQPARGHLYKPTVTRAATVDQEGEETYTCVRCGDSYTEPIPKLEPNEADSTPGSQPADVTSSTQQENPPDLESTPSESEGDAQDNGGDTQTGGAQSESSSQTGSDQHPAEGTASPSISEEPQQEECRHNWEFSYATPATCTEEAQYYYVCTRCGKEEVKRTTPAKGHNYTASVNREPTVDQEGLRTYTCTRCGDTYTESIPKLAQSEAALKTGYRDSGSTSMEKLSQQEIQQLLEENPLTLPDDVYEVKPSVTAPYSAGKIKTSALQAAVNRLNAMRRIAGVPDVSQDLERCERAQYGAVVLAALNTGLSHTPSRPADMDTSFYQKATAATASSNLVAGRTLTGAVDAFMEDTGTSNLSSVGHRRWQLNPTLGKVGFGFAQSTRGGGYVAEQVFDRSGAGCDYDFIAWPASGNFPAQLFSSDIAWSVTLNPDEYQIPGKSDITVTLTRESDGRTWTFSSRGSDGAFNVDTNGYGVANAIVFRPDGVDQYKGTYTVRIDGLKARNGQKVADFTYQVDFFGEKTSGLVTVTEPTPESTNEPGDPDTTPGTVTASSSVFRDVPATYWAADAIRTAVEHGIVNGYADGTFHPTASVTHAHFNAMLARAFYPGQAKDDSGSGRWWYQYVSLNQEHGLLNNTTLQAAQVLKGSYDSAINTPINRYNMAVMMYNLLLDLDASLPSSADRAKAQKAIGDWGSIPAAYQDAVSTCYALGLLNGQNNGSFGGGNPMTRAQGCVVLDRLADYLN